MPICTPLHEQLLIAAGAPLSARSTAIEVWRSCFPRWHPLAVEVVDNDRPIALALLGWRRRWGWIDVIRLGPQDEPGCVVGRDAATAARLAADIRQALDTLRWPWRLRLVNLSDSAVATAALATALAGTRRVRAADSAELGVSSGEAFSKVVSRNTRAAVAKARNRIARGGHRLDLLWLCDPADVSETLPQVLRLHRARNTQLRREQFSRDPAIAAYLRERVLAHSREQRVELLLACIDQHLAAFALCFRDGRVLQVFANLTSPGWLPYSAGAIANHEVIAHAWSDTGIDTVDWGLGLQRYKLSGRVDIVSHESLEAFSSIGTSACIRAAERGKAWVGALGNQLARWRADPAV